MNSLGVDALQIHCKTGYHACMEGHKIVQNAGQVENQKGAGSLSNSSFFSMDYGLHFRIPCSYEELHLTDFIQ
jgi:hypothetical protein